MIDQMTSKLRSDYDQKFTCQRCGETIFVQGVAADPAPSICAICLTGVDFLWKGRGHDLPEGLRFSPDLHALMAIASANREGIKSLHCIYLDADGKAEKDWPRKM